jgi:hypothetical protein
MRIKRLELLVLLLQKRLQHAVVARLCDGHLRAGFPVLSNNRERCGKKREQ